MIQELMTNPVAAVTAVCAAIAILARPRATLIGIIAIVALAAAIDTVRNGNNTMAVAEAELARNGLNISAYVPFALLIATGVIVVAVIMTIGRDKR